MPKLQLYLPVKPKVVTQPFGVNGAYYQSQGVNIVGHNGLDLAALHGQPIYAAHDGMAYYEYDGKQGEGVVLHTNQTFDYNGTPTYWKSIYWHMCDPVKEPQFTSPVYKAVGYKPDITGVSNVGIAVKCGDLIGYADNTGLSSGDHLHFGLKPEAPGEPAGSWWNVEQNNGYGGAIDPAPYLLDTFAEDFAVARQLTEKAVQVAQEVTASISVSNEQKVTLLTTIRDLIAKVVNMFSSK